MSGSWKCLSLLWSPGSWILPGAAASKERSLHTNSMLWDLHWVVSETMGRGLFDESGDPCLSTLHVLEIFIWLNSNSCWTKPDMDILMTWRTPMLHDWSVLSSVCSLNPPWWWSSRHKWLALGKICALTSPLTHLMEWSLLPANSKLKWIKSSLTTSCCHPPGSPLFLWLGSKLHSDSQEIDPLLCWDHRIYPSVLIDQRMDLISEVLWSPFLFLIFCVELRYILLWNTCTCIYFLHLYSVKLY
jgi:hypothetical protein